MLASFRRDGDARCLRWHTCDGTHDVVCCKCRWVQLKSRTSRQSMTTGANALSRSRKQQRYAHLHICIHASKELQLHATAAESASPSCAAAQQAHVLRERSAALAASCLHVVAFATRATQCTTPRCASHAPLLRTPSLRCRSSTAGMTTCDGSRLPQICGAKLSAPRSSITAARGVPGQSLTSASLSSWPRAWRQSQCALQLPLLFKMSASDRALRQASCVHMKPLVALCMGTDSLLTSVAADRHIS